MYIFWGDISGIFCPEEMDVTLRVELENVKRNTAFGLGLPQLTRGVWQEPGTLWRSVPGERAFPHQAFVPQKTLWQDEDVCLPVVAVAAP